MKDIIELSLRVIKRSDVRLL